MITLPALREKSQVLAAIRWCEQVKVKRKPALEWLLSVVAHTPDAEVRNRAALALGKLRVQAAVPIIIGLLSTEKTTSDRGSLLYALQSLNYLDYLDDIAAQLDSGVYEVMEMALQLLEQLPRRLTVRQTQKAMKRLEQLALEETNTVRDNYVSHGLLLLKQSAA